MNLIERVFGEIQKKEFVGSYTGSQAKKTGYGIYGMPLARFLDRK
jgi:hypothetical protein